MTGSRDSSQPPAAKIGPSDAASREDSISWPASYEPPVVEPLGTVWERTGGGGGPVGDGVLSQST